MQSLGFVLDVCLMISSIVKARAVETRLVEVLRGPHEAPGLPRTLVRRVEVASSRGASNNSAAAAS